MNRIHRSKSATYWCAIFSLAAVLIGPLVLRAADGANITYRRIFKGSNPEFIEIKIGEDGSATYDIRQLSEDADPQPFQVSATVRTTRVGAVTNRVQTDLKGAKVKAEVIGRPKHLYSIYQKMISRSQSVWKN